MKKKCLADIVKINYFLIIVATLIVSTSCNQESPEEKLEKEVRNQLEEIFEDPTVLDNSVENNTFLNNFQDSGIYNHEKQKTGLWIEYKEDLLNQVPN
ncbi:MAG: hypothetical protein H6586_08400 [Flavobacteriales bacterium]|nr:hypothetical protein [Flavobacteriales bacterium]